MADEQKDKNVCQCPCCRWGAYAGMGPHVWHGHIILRLLIGIIIVGVAFWVGFQLGELRASVFNSGYYGFGMMRGYGYRSGYAAPMMQYYGTQAAPAAPATP